MFFNFSSAPLVRAAIYFIVGILLFQVFFNAYVFLWFLCPSLLIVWILHRYFHSSSLQYKYYIYSSLLLSICIVALGYITAAAHSPIFQPKHYTHYIKNPDFIACDITVIQTPQKTYKGYKVKASCDHIYIANKHVSCHGYIMLYLNDTNTSIARGNQYCIYEKPQAIYFAQNPGMFDRIEHYNRQYIYHQFQINSNQLVFINHKRDAYIPSMIHQFRSSSENRLYTYMEDSTTAQIAAALLLGLDDDVDPTIINAYAASGVIHVLSVSGLHVGMFYLIIGYLFSFFSIKSMWMTGIKVVLSLLLVWSYSWLSGFSPSVLRSAVMLTFVILSVLINRKISIYNSLAASCLFLLVLDVNYLFNIGFILSYSAVFSIVYFQDKLYHLFYIKNYVVDKLWNMCSVSISAQVFTTPFSLYFFHRFPLYFLPANLIIVPIISVSLPLGYLFLVCSAWAPSCLVLLLGRSLHYILFACNHIAIFFSNAPNAILDNIYISTIECILLTIFILLFSVAIFNKQIRLLGIAVTICISIFINNGLKKINETKNKQVIIYHVPRSRCIQIISNKHSILLTDSIAEQSYQFYAKQGIDYYNRHRQVTYTTSKKYNYKLTYSTYTILLMDKPMPDSLLLFPYTHIIVSNASLYQHQLPLVSSSTLIFDGSNNATYINKMITFHKMKTYSTNLCGAFILDHSSSKKQTY